MSHMENRFSDCFDVLGFKNDDTVIELHVLTDCELAIARGKVYYFKFTDKELDDFQLI